MKNASRTLFVVLTLLICHVCLAGVPTVMSYQGRLADSSGAPMVDGTASMVFRLYSQPTGGTALWTESQSVLVAGGIFSVFLGSAMPLPDAAFTGTTYLVAISLKAISHFTFMRSPISVQSDHSFQF